MKTIRVGRFQFQRKTKKEWEESSLVLYDGELALEAESSKIKIGDGKHTYKDLGYVTIGEAGLKDLTEEEIESLRGPQGKNLSVDTYTYDKDGNTIITFSDKSSVTVKKGDPGSIDISTWTEEQKKEFIEKLGIPEPDLSGYVTKEEGKGLSTNDYDNAAKSKVDAIPSNPKYTDTTYDLSPYAKTADVVAKVDGKGLSTNDYDNVAKGKVDAIPEGFVYKDTEYIFGKGLKMADNVVSIDEKYIWETVNLEYIFNKDKDLYIALNAITGLNFTSSIQTLDDLVNSEVALGTMISSDIGLTMLVASGTAMDSILANETAMNAIINSSTAMDSILANETAMDSIVVSKTAMDSIAASKTAMDSIAASKTAMDSIVVSKTAMDSIAASKTAMDSIAASQTAMDSIAASQTAMGAITDSEFTISVVSDKKTGNFIILGSKDRNVLDNSEPIDVSDRANRYSKMTYSSKKYGELYNCYKEIGYQKLTMIDSYLTDSRYAVIVLDLDKLK